MYGTYGAGLGGLRVLASRVTPLLLALLGLGRWKGVRYHMILRMSSYEAFMIYEEPRLG